MTVKATAMETKGVGCIKGDFKVMDAVEMVFDKGTYYEVYFHKNRQMRFDKKAWELRITEFI